MVRLLFIILLGYLAGCQQTFVMESEQIVSPTAASTPVVLAGTPQSRSVPTRAATIPPAIESDPTMTLTPDRQLAGPWLSPTPSLTLMTGEQVIGQSVEGRDITVRHIGSGPRIILLVGGIHGGWEENTVALVNELIAHFENTPEDILPGMSLAFVPSANPDGLIHGRVEVGRFNANGVDLNRNWGCDWSEDAIWRSQSVFAGSEPMSEPETQALAQYIQDTRPVIVLFYHSSAGGVYAGECDGDHGSMIMSQILGEATGYSYGEVFTAYPVTGTAASWVDGQGIPSADVELFSWTETEFERNLNGIMRLQRWLSE